MFASNASHFNSVVMGPQRDVLGEVSAAVRAEGLRVIATLHHQWLWAWYPTFNASLSHDTADAAYQLTAAHGGLYGPRVSNSSAFDPPCKASELFQDYFLAKALEVVSYEPDVIYFDSKWAAVVDDVHRLAFLANYYNAAAAAGRDVVVTYKDSDLEVGAGLLDLERGGTAGTLYPKWQTDDAMDRHSWSWVNPPSLKNATELTGELCDIVSKNGNFLLDIPPHADGSIDPAVEAVLLKMGAWLGTNGAAIFATVPWRTFGEGPTAISPDFNHEWPLFTPRDFRFTAARDGSAVFLLAMAHGPPKTTYTVSSLNATALAGLSDVTLIGSTARVPWSQDATSLRIGAVDVPPGQDASLPLAFRLHLHGASAAHIDAPTEVTRARILRP